MAHWTETLFKENADLYARDFELGMARVARDTPSLAQLLAELGVGAGSNLLDMPCGNGSWSVGLASLGYKVEGLDFSEPFIEAAKRKASERGVSDHCSFSSGDMRETSTLFSGRSFDAVLNLWTSLGYYDDETDLSVLTQFRDVTRKGGYLIIDHVNRDYFVRNFSPMSLVDMGDVVRTEARLLNHETSRMENTRTYYRKQGENLIHLKTIRFDNRLYNLHELKNLLIDAGWTLKAYYSGFDKTPYNWNMIRLVLIAENPS
jgi:2-polyprenyl-3-methyl-5-hydroxy-6-metoxy-1,4-benzoquinol methylase